jgi:hypothetical protein
MHNMRYGLLIGYVPLSSHVFEGLEILGAHSHSLCRVYYNYVHDTWAPGVSPHIYTQMQPNSFPNHLTFKFSFVSIL